MTEPIFGLACYCSECENKSYALRVTDDGVYNLHVQTQTENYTVEFPSLEVEQKIILAELAHCVFKMIEMIIVEYGKELQEVDQDE